jgi:hypothetical protein
MTFRVFRDKGKWNIGFLYRGTRKVFLTRQKNPEGLPHPAKEPGRSSPKIKVESDAKKPRKVFTFVVYVCGYRC